MADIYAGIAIIGALAVGCFAAAWTLSRKAPRLVCDIAALVVVVAIFAYIRWGWYNTRLAEILPFSNLVVLGNWFPLAAALLGGLAWQRIPGRMYRKALFIGTLIAASAYSSIFPLLGDSPKCGESWWHRICLQTTPKTCTPACAATLLRAHGIRATEREMARLCLTREGTTWMGLYRGLKLKTKNTPWDVEVLSCNADQLLATNGNAMILSVGMSSHETHEDQLKMVEWGWKPGIGHSVIMLRRCGRRVAIADPTPGVGQEEWSEDDVRQLFRGTALRLVKRY